jgi:hypothetical protein
MHARYAVTEHFLSHKHFFSFLSPYSAVSGKIKVKVKVKFALEHATKSQRGSIGISLLFF